MYNRIIKDDSGGGERMGVGFWVKTRKVTNQNVVLVKKFLLKCTSGLLCSCLFDLRERLTSRPTLPNLPCGVSRTVPWTDRPEAPSTPSVTSSGPTSHSGDLDEDLDLGTLRSGGGVKEPGDGVTIEVSTEGTTG